MVRLIASLLVFLLAALLEPLRALVLPRPRLVPIPLRVEARPPRRNR